MISKEKAFETVSSCSLFQGISPLASRAVIGRCHLKEAAVGEMFFYQGDNAQTMYVLAEGRVKLSSVTADGHQVIVNYIESGDGMAIIVALSGMACPVSAEAIEFCIALAWHRDDMYDLMHHYPELALNGIKMIGGRFATLHQRYQDVSTLRVEQRVARAIVRLVRQFGKQTAEGILIDVSLTREELAQMTGTNHYSTSRILSKWEQEGIVLTGRKRVVLLNAHALVAIAEDLPASNSTKR